MVELKVPSLGESVREATIERWLKKEGEFVKRDEPVVALESDKANVEVPAPIGGVLSKILKGAGAKVAIGETIANLEPATMRLSRQNLAGTALAPTPEMASVLAAVTTPSGGTPRSQVAAVRTEPGSGSPPAAPSPATSVAAPAAPVSEVESHLSPTLRRLAREMGLDLGKIAGTGPGKSLTPMDVLREIDKKSGHAPEVIAAAAPSTNGGRVVEKVAMTSIRKKIAERLVRGRLESAILTTFNECDMSRIMALREEHKERFLQKHGVKLGFMSFFVKAVIEGLKLIPELNAFIEGTDIVYHRYYDIGVAVGGGKGLLVPVIRNAERLSLADIEKTIEDFGKRAKDNKIMPDELSGGTFTISNGGTYGSLLSTPLLNMPQSGILGMHAIQKRPMVVNDKIEVRPMMYIAASYDHRIVDGREAVRFLVRVKECIESPDRVVLEV